MEPKQHHSKHCDPDPDLDIDPATNDPKEIAILTVTNMFKSICTPEDEAEWASFFDPRRHYNPASNQLPPDSTTIDELEEEVYLRSKKIFDDWAVLQKILQRNEDLLRKRWSKKTREQRKKVLLTAWPNMAPNHRPDFRAFYRIPDAQKSNNVRFRDHFLLPYINVEDLIQGNLLPTFINARGRHSPDTFTHADWDAANLGHKCGAIRSRWFNCYTMLFLGRSTPETYGALTNWIMNYEAKGWLEMRIGFLPGQGMIILEIQQKILHFLVQCCYLIFQDMPSTSLIDESVAIRPEPAFLPAADGLFPSLETVAAEAPYRVPAHLNVERLQSMVFAKRSAAEDHHWTLREDPGYFSDTIKAYSEHRTERLLDAKGKVHHILDQPVFWDRVLGYTVAQSYSNFELWDTIYRQLVILAISKEKHSDSISASERLPAELEDIFQALVYLINEASKYVISALLRFLPTSPRFRSFYHRYGPLPGKTLVAISLRRKSVIQEDRVLWLFHSISTVKRLNDIRLSPLMEELERSIQEDIKQKERITPLIAQTLSDLAVIAEISRQLSLFQPWAAGMEVKADSHRDMYAKKFEGNFIITDFVKDFDGMFTPLSRLGKPSDGRFTYPTNQRKTKTTTEAMRKAEQNLDLFWSSIDAHFSNKSPRLKIIKNHMLGRRQFQRTPEWVESTIEKEKIPLMQSYIPLPTLNLTEKDDARFNSPAAVDPHKIKTRGPALVRYQHSDPGLGSEPEPTCAERFQEIHPSFTVSKRVFKTFMTLFHNPSEPNQPGEIPWLDFLHALAAVGFAIEKLGGSEWQFVPTTTDLDRNIFFHEPHPHKKIPYLQARRHGRRLHRVYGWTRDSFLLAEGG